MAVPPLLADGDRPGVLWGRGLAVAIAEHGLVPGRRAAVLGPGTEAEALAARLSGIGVAVETAGGGAAGARARAGARPGAARRDAAGLRHGGGGGAAGPGHRSRPATSARRSRFDEAAGAFALAVDADGATGVPGLWAAGEVTGAMGAQRAAEAGRRAGEAARG